MDNLESLTDSELRHRLIQYGFPNVPITGTTRKLLIKKLRNHLNNEKLKLHKETTFATRYSSDEESDFKKLDNNAKPKPSRSTFLSRSTTTRYSSNNNNINNNKVMPPPKSPPVTATVRRTYAPTSLGRTNISRNYYDYDYQSNIEKASPPLSRVYVSPVIKANDGESDDSDYNYYNSDKQNNNTTSSRYQSSYLMTPDRTQINNTLPDYLNDSDYNDNSINGSINVSKPQQPPAPSSNYMSDFTHRLLKLRGETLKTNPRRTVPKTAYTPRFSRQYMANRSESYYTKDNTTKSKSFLLNLLSKFNIQNGLKHSFIPYLLIGVLVIFFSILIFMYLTMQPDIEAALTEKNTNYELCSNVNSHTGISSVTCITDYELKGTLELIKTIAPILHVMAVDYKCKDNTKSYLLSGADVIRIGKQNDLINQMPSLRMLLRNMEYLIDRNPHWNLCNVNDKGEKLHFQEVLNLRSQYGNYFAVLEPQIPLSCKIYYRMQIFFLLIGSVGIILLIGSIFYFLYKMIYNYRKSKQDNINYFINKIISTLMHKAAFEPENPCVVINHLRDKLIPLHKRKTMEYTWNEAVNYLESNESRIQFEITIINGEDCKVLKWIDTVSSDQIQLQQHQQQHQFQQPQRSTIKKWQSPAFDKAANKIVNPPTSCLKIRQMFDKFEASNDINLKTNIQDAILEKVGPQCKIYDIVLDKQTCCVYVRCATEKDAGIVHNEINGWWFDKRLVSIKFLRLERFLNRFPKSTSSICLYPSNSKKLSMPTKIEYCEDDDDDDDDDDSEN